MKVDEEVIQLKAKAYDVSKEINKLTILLRDINTKIEQLSKTDREAVASSK